MRGTEHLKMEPGQSSQENTYANVSDLDLQRKKKNTEKVKEIPASRSKEHRVILILGVLLILAFITLVILISSLFIFYKRLSGTQSHLEDKVYNLSFQLEAYKKERSSLSNNIRRALGAMGKLAEHMQKSGSSLCSEGWTYYGLSCYYMSSSFKSWNSAKEDCQNKTANLVVINVEDEMNFLRNFAQSDIFWIGLAEENGTWAWVDGTSHESTPTFWQDDKPLDLPGHSDGKEKDCVQITYGDHWETYKCSWSFRYICEKEIL
ncbi:C-type lectin domain family 10 member A-like [Lithobates pipiens]